MPTVLRVDGFEIKILLPPREHGPPHVHVWRAGGHAVIELSPVGVRDIDNMRDADVVKAVRIVEDHLDALRDAWRRYHG